MFVCVNKRNKRKEFTNFSLQISHFLHFCKIKILQCFIKNYLKPFMFNRIFVGQYSRRNIWWNSVNVSVSKFVLYPKKPLIVFVKKDSSVARPIDILNFLERISAFFSASLRLSPCKRLNAIANASRTPTI